jgi:translation initiation factor IF-3
LNKSQPNRNIGQGKHKINEQISSKMIFLMNEQRSIVNENMPIAQALQYVHSQGHDLIELGIQDGVDARSICIHADYKKWIYAAEKHAKKNRLPQLDVSKECRFSIISSINDTNRKCEQVLKFLLKGYTVRISMKLHGILFQQRADDSDKLIQYILDYLQNKQMAVRSHQIDPKSWILSKQSK